MNPRRVATTVVLTLMTAASARAQTATQPTEQESSSSSLTAALFAPMLPEAPSTSTTSKPTPRRASKWKPQTSISLGVFGNLTPANTGGDSYGSGYTKFNNTPGVLGTFRQSFRPWLGYSLNMGYTRATEQNVSTYFYPLPPGGSQGAGGTTQISVPANVYELTLSHIAQAHLSKKITIFSEVGAGMLAFNPHGPAEIKSTIPGYSMTTPLSVDILPTGVFGGGLEYHFTSQLGLRTEFRGQLHKNADFGIFSKNTTFTSQPTVSLTYTFGAPKTYRR